MSGQHGKRKLSIRSEYDEEYVPVDNLREAERMFARLASKLLLDELGTSESPYSLDSDCIKHGESTV